MVIIVSKKKIDNEYNLNKFIDNSAVMIEAVDVSMKFNLGIEKGFSIKQWFVDLGKNKKKRKNDFWALKDVNFKVNKGEVIGFIGSNGAGKSTLLKVVAGVMKPTNGEVRAYGNICPMIELGAGFDPQLTARENIYLNGAILGYTKEFLDSKFKEIVEFSELGDFINMPIRNYSSGMMARLAFSIATVVKPEILIVDEILSVGDAGFQAKSLKRMMELMSGGTTVLFVSHTLKQIEELCNRVVWLEDHKVKKVGDVKEICEEYRRMWES